MKHYTPRKETPASPERYYTKSSKLIYLVHNRYNLIMSDVEISTS